MHLFSLRTFAAFTVATFTMTSIAAYAGDELDKYDQEALQETQKLLNDIKKLEKEGLPNDAARKQHESVKAMMGSDQHTQEVYKTSAAIFEDLMKQHKGDVLKVMESLQKNPEAFAKQLKPEHQQQIRDLATKIEASKANKSK